jgi:pSer/pThr/pTyr-binding forkhead associated (FHA) protein
MIANRCPNPNCEYFNRTLPNNAKVCPMCGTPLGNVIDSTPASDKQATPIVERSTTTPPISYAPPTSTPVQSPARPILILTHTNGREFRLLGEEGNIGRRTQTYKTLPEIDLTGIPNEGIVSRTHARIYWHKSQNVYLLVDNNSRNGTYLNGNLLTAGVPYKLNHNDSLQLGQDQLVCFTVSLI